MELNECLEEVDLSNNPLQYIKINKNLKSISLSHPENKKITIDNAIGNQNVIVDYNFNSEAGNFKNRFELVYREFEPQIIDENTILAYKENTSLIITSSNEEIKHIIAFDLLGRTLLSEVGINTFEFETNKLSNTNQPILLKIILNNGQVILKKIIM